MQQNESNLGSKSSSKPNHEKLVKTADGSNYVKWIEKLEVDFTTNSAICVKQFGPDLLTEQTSWLESFQQEYDESDEHGKASLQKKKAARQDAVEIIYQLIVNRLSEEVKQLVKADPVFVGMQANVRSRDVFGLLKILRKVVNSGITSDASYETMVNVKSLHEVRQGQASVIRESCHQYLLATKSPWQR